eukprot:gnl/TRDRNA2_/TRDRNA2_186772_c0_seq1.p1 gnl/TRDRNA2_/TRDRNA2_186772_c0~~gnl/TRDRNA2_/TRDRNA2_186772_c0_seq1.p1  ORF type:complete len:453 (-),score=73.36 gnl/TRDRNA2_/TRDRNA2_186772_c0_seq1:93-1451(-)
MAQSSVCSLPPSSLHLHFRGMAQTDPNSEQNAKADAEKARKQSEVNALVVHMGLNVASLTVTMTQRISLVTQVTKMSSAEAASFLAMCSGGVGVVEFFLNPLAGKLSDAYGRKVFIMQSPLVSAVLKAFVFLYPSKLSIGVERLLSGALTTIGGSTSTSNAISDILADDKVERAAATTSLGLATGFGLVLGPMIGTWVSGTKNPGRAYGVGALLSVLHFFISTNRVTESLAIDKRKPMPGGAELAKSLNPLSFVDLFQRGSVLTRLVMVAALQFFTEGKCTADLNGYYMVNEVKMPDNARALYNSIWGGVMIVGGKLGGKTIKNFGMRAHTTLQNFATALAMSMIGASTLPALIFSSLAVNCFAMERGSAVRSMALAAANDVGMGNGEFGAKFANMRAVVVALGPVLYAKVYAFAKKSKLPAGLPFFVGALIVLLSEALHRTFTNDELKVKS